MTFVVFALIGSANAQYSGEYFNNINLTGPAAFTRTDKVINFKWSDGNGPWDDARNIQLTTNFSVRWTHTVAMTKDQKYFFQVSTDDGVRIKLDGTTIIDKFWAQGTTSYKYTTNIGWTGNHTVVVEYFQGGGGADIEFYYCNSSNKDIQGQFYVNNGNFYNSTDDIVYVNSPTFRAYLYGIDGTVVRKHRISENNGSTWTNVDGSPDATPYLYNHDYTLSNQTNGQKNMAVEYGRKLGYGDTCYLKVYYDNVLPGAVSNPNPANNAYTGDATPLLQWSAASDSGSGLHAFPYRVVLNGVAQSWQSALNFTPGANLSEGDNTWRVEVRDKAGNVKTNGPLWTVKVDLTPPTGYTIKINNGDTYTKSRNVTVTLDNATDAMSGVSQYHLYTNTTLADTNYPGNPTDVALTLPATEGLQTVYVAFKDAVGNWNTWATPYTWQSDQITLDTVAPTVTLSDDQSDAVVRQGEVVNITATFVDATSGIDETAAPKITIGSLVTNAAMVKTSNLVWTYQWTVPAGNDGAQAVTITAADRAGWANSAATGRTSYTIDNIAPAAFSNSTPLDNSWVNTCLPTFTWTNSNDTGGSGMHLTEPYQFFADAVAKEYLTTNTFVSDVTSGLVSRYGFDDETRDLSGTNDGAWVGSASYTDGKFGRAALFDGTGASYISIPSSASLKPANQLTVSLWMNRDVQPANWSAIFHKGGTVTGGFANRTYSLWLPPNGNNWMYVASAPTVAGATNHQTANGTLPSQSVWHHVV
ncbi:MAG TPA: PA14 domain-containing protein, partial [Candidatus Wallbacteria bacterium]|nr:PA14 domain-containing protein [Candidatus Wallbacteria bacterium]